MHSPHPSLRPAVPLAALTATAAAVLVLLPAAPASAHDQLVSADPASGSTVTAVQRQVRLTFAEPLVDLGGHRNGVVVLDARGRHYETACAAVSGERLTSPVALGAPGEYRVRWRAVSPDSHVVGATYSFRYRPAAGAARSAGSTAGPACGDIDAEGAQQPPAAVPAVAVIAGGIGGLAVVAVVVAVVVVAARSRRGDGAGR